MAESQTQLKARLLESMRTAETLDKLERYVRYLHHARRTERITFSQYHDLLGAAGRARASFASPGQQGGAA